MSLPVVLPGSCCPVAGVSLASPLADPTCRSRARCVSGGGGGGGAPRTPAPQSRLFPTLLPGRPLLSLALLQLVLGCSMVALSFGALSLSSSLPIRTSCPFWAGSSVILSGIVGLTTWRRPMLLLVNLFVLLSVVCVLLNLAGFILCCQGAQLVSSMSSCQLQEAMWELAEEAKLVTEQTCCKALCKWFQMECSQVYFRKRLMSDIGDVCLCCADSPSTKCPEEKLLKLYPGHSCNTMRVLLKKVLFALCALNALTTAVCLVAAALRYLQIFAARRPCSQDEPQPVIEEGEEPTHIPDPDEFVAPAPPPSYFSTFYSYTPRLARRMFGGSVIPLPHIYGARIKGVEVFCPLDPPPPYEAVARQPDHTSLQETQVQVTDLTEGLSERSGPQSDAGSLHTPATPQGQARPPKAFLPASIKACRQQFRRSNSDPVLLQCAAKSTVLSCEAATQTDARLEAAVVTLRRGRGPRRPRPTSMVDYQSYRDTKQLVTRFLEHSSSSLTPEVQELVDSIKTMLRSDQEHMEEAVQSASFIDKVMTNTQAPPTQPAQPPQPPQPQAAATSQTLPLRKRPGLLHLRSCGDLSTFTKEEPQSANGRSGSPVGSAVGSGSRTGSRAGSRAEHERPHSLIGVFRETVL